MPPSEASAPVSTNAQWLSAVRTFPRGGIAGALLVRVVLFSTAITLVLTVFQLTLSYRSERSRLDDRLSEIEASTARSLGESLWALDRRQLEEQLDGLLRLPSIRAVEVRETSSPIRSFVVARGQPQGARFVERRVSLTCCGAQAQTIGTLHIQATLTEIYSNLVAQAAVILLSNAAKTFLVAFFILYIVHRLATRHLLDITASVAGVTPEADVTPLVLRRAGLRGDELDRLVEAINAMRDRLRQHTLDLKNANARMATLLDNMPDLAWVKDAQGHFIAVNRALAAMKGIAEPIQLVGKSDLDIEAPDVARAYQADDIAVMASRGSRRIEETLAHADGSTTLFETIKTALLDIDGKVVGTVGIARDISARRQAEADREARRVAEIATAAKSAFLAHMSHEIRTPMNAIIGMSHLALQGPLDTAQRDRVRKVHGAAKSLLGIINDILDLSKIEAGKLDIESVPFDLAEILDGLVTLTALNADEKGVELILSLPPDLPTPLVGDPTRLRQVLLNLCNNAVKFTAKGEVVVGVDMVERRTDAVRLRFDVQDTGIGIPLQVQQRLFQPFAQADSSTSRQYGGTGLGLTISRQLVEMMGGSDIGIDSAPGSGSTFHFELGFALHPSAAQAAWQPPAELVGRRVLVVDDNARARAIVARLCTAFGMEANACASAAEAVSLVRQAAAAGRPYELKLIDWNMPEVDGIECADLLQRDRPPGGAPDAVLMVSPAGLSTAQQMAQARGLVMGALMEKPVMAATLADACLRALGVVDAKAVQPARRDKTLNANQALLRGARLLLVDDNEINREIGVAFLEDSGIQVRTAGDGREALEMLAREHFDGVLMDCQMPVMDGYEATRRLRQHMQWRDLPVIAMTANALTSDRDKVIDSGMNDHVTKPINVEHLFATLARWVKPGNAAAG
jgi:PAS domain S-box-containing protein